MKSTASVIIEEALNYLTPDNVSISVIFSHMGKENYWSVLSSRQTTLDEYGVVYDYPLTIESPPTELTFHVNSNTLKSPNDARKIFREMIKYLEELK